MISSGNLTPDLLILSPMAIHSATWSHRLLNEVNGFVVPGFMPSLHIYCTMETGGAGGIVLYS